MDTPALQTDRKALFIDRDGVINEDTAYPCRPDQITFNEAVFTLCRSAALKGYLLIVITNQAGVAKGKFSEEDVQKLHQWMAGEFGKRGISLARFYYCPHHPDAIVPKYRIVCNCRKPKPGMVLDAVRDFGIEVRSSIVIGDKPSDRIEIEGLRSIIVKSRYTGDDFDVEGVADIEKYL